MPNYLTIESSYINALASHIVQDIASAAVLADYDRVDVPVQSVYVDENNNVVAKIMIGEHVNGTITQIYLFDQFGNVLASKDVSISRSDPTTGLLYVCRISLFQVVNNDTDTGAYDAL